MSEEIARLKAELDQSRKLCQTWIDKSARETTLIAELADALYDHMGFNTKRTFTQDEKLVQRAREATK